MSHTGFDTDVFVAGGGPAGLAAAIAARQKGLRVTLADGAAPPIDKACGEGLMPGALAALEALGIGADALDGFPFRGIRFLGPGVSVEARFPSGAGLGVRRVALHEALAARASRLGVALLWGTRVTGVTLDGVSLDGKPFRARWVIGADGSGSRVRRWAGLDGRGRGGRRFGFRRHYRVAPWTGHTEIYWNTGFQAYVTPVGEEEVCVAAISSHPGLRLQEALERCPDLAARLRGAGECTPERGAVSVSRRLDSVFQGRVALVGDASGSVDAITGEGLGLSFRQALAAAECMAGGSLADYGKAHRRIARRPEWMASLMLSLDRHAWLRRAVLPALASRPELFSRMLATHVGALSAPRFAATAVVPLLMRMLGASNR